MPAAAANLPEPPLTPHTRYPSDGQQAGIGNENAIGKFNYIFIICHPSRGAGDRSLCWDEFPLWFPGLQDGRGAVPAEQDPLQRRIPV